MHKICQKTPYVALQNAKRKSTVLRAPASSLNAFGLVETAFHSKIRFSYAGARRKFFYASAVGFILTQKSLVHTKNTSPSTKKKTFRRPEKIITSIKHALLSIIAIFGPKNSAELRECLFVAK